MPNLRLVAASGLAVLFAPGLAGQVPVYSIQAGSPRPGAAVFDSGRGVVVMAEAGTPGRLWEWNGARFAERMDVTSINAGYMAAAHDSRRGRLLWLRGGTTLSVDEWDGAQWQYTSSPTAPATGSVAGAAFDPRRGRFVVLHSDSAAVKVSEWDGSRWWTFALASAPVTRAASAVAWDPQRAAVICHGGVASGVMFADTWSWDGQAWTQVSSGGGPGSRAGAAFTFDPNTGGVLLYGGLNGQTVLNDTWLLGASGWTQLLPATGPAPRVSAGLVHDGTGLLLYGGRDAYSTTADPVDLYWRWNGVTWQRLNVDGEPVGFMRNHAFVWDETRGEAVLFGGFWVTLLADTWTWNGSWRRQRPANSPSPRAAVSIAPDPQRGTVVMFGGLVAGVVNDTWTWDGVDWTLRQPNNAPAPRHYAAMAYDRARNVVLLHGGNDPTTVYGDLWQWNGTDWSAITAPGGPAPRYMHAMAFDQVRGRMVLFGGFGSPMPTDTWEWNGSAWIATNPVTVPGFAPTQLCMTFDAAAGRVVLESGWRYHWTGIDWLATAPAGALGGVIAYDPGRRALLSFPVPNSGRLGLLTSTPAGVSGFASGCGLGGAPGLGAVGRPQLGTASFALEVQTFAGAVPTLLLLAAQPQTTSLGSGCAVLTQPLLAHFAVASAAGWTRLSLAVPARTALLGLQVFAQAVVLDPAHSQYSGVTISGGLRVAVGY